jgi:uncharacterized protein YabN with tetrapyrrole methylase and pyrophosphatase domain
MERKSLTDSEQNQWEEFLWVLTKNLDTCPWLKIQTLESLKHALENEGIEVREAIDADSRKDIEEELGDVLYVVLTLILIAQRDGITTLEQTMNGVVKKMIHRKPWVFGDLQVDTPEEAARLWAERKQTNQSL